MSLDAAAFPALWAISDATGVRPEWLLPVLNHESGLNPSLPNGAGAPYYGIGQNSTADIASYAGVDPATYLTWPASAQLSTVVKGYLTAAVHSYGPLRSGTRVYQAEYLPATLTTARKLSDTIASAADDPHGFYRANAGLDVNHDGVITLGDLATIVAAEARKAAVQQAITATYAARDSTSPGSSNPNDVDHIVYGDDFGGEFLNSPWGALGICAAIALTSAAVAYYIIEDKPRAIRKYRRRHL
jgi:hypothetical protein